MFNRRRPIPLEIPQPPGYFPEERLPSPYWLATSGQEAQRKHFPFEEGSDGFVINNGDALSATQEDVLGREDSLMLNQYLSSNPKRRGAICEEIEKLLYFVKINGVWMNLSDLRKECFGLIKKKSLAHVNTRGSRKFKRSILE